MYEEIIYLLNSVGFPIVITLWFMFRVEKIIGNNTKILQKIEKKLC